MIKKTTAVLIALALAGTMSACGSVNENAAEVSEEKSEIARETETKAEETTEDSADEQTVPDSDSLWLYQLIVGEDKNDHFTESTTAPEPEIIASSDGLYYIPANSTVFSRINTEDNPYILSVGVDSQAAAKSLRAYESGYSHVMSNDSILGTIIELDSDANDEITRAVIRFEIKDEYLDNTLGTYAPVGPEFQGVRRLNVFKWMEDMNMALPIESQIDGNTVYCEVDELGTYDITDMELWLDMLGIAPPDDTVSNGAGGGTAGNGGGF